MSRIVCIAALGLAAGIFARAQDSPVVIGNGSPLKLTSADPWVKNSETELMPPKVEHAVTKVEVSVPGAAPQIVPFSGHRCDLEVQYGDITAAVLTEANGRRMRLQIRPRRLLDDFTLSPDGRTYTSKNGTDSVTHVLVKRNGQVLLDLTPAAQPVKVTIHYE